MISQMMALEEDSGPFKKIDVEMSIQSELLKKTYGKGGPENPALESNQVRGVNNGAGLLLHSRQ